MIPDPAYPPPYLDKKNWPAVSIVVPAHNEEAYLDETLVSIKRAIAEVDVVAQIIVVNDASTDRTSEIANDHGVHLVSVDLRNIGAVRNAGAAAAVNEWLFFLDADTLLPAKTLADSLKALERGALGGGAHVTIPDLRCISLLKQLMYYSVLVGWQVFGRWAAGCYMFCQKETFDEFGGFDEEFFACEEFFFSREIKRRGLFRLIRHPVVTSSRKLHSYSSWQLARFLLLPLISPQGRLRSRYGLEVLYQDDR